MRKTLVITQKEARELFRNRSVMLIGLAFVIFFSISYSLGITRSEAGTTMTLDGTLFYLSLSIALFMAYVSTAQLFLIEKREAVIETLMCAPVSLRQIWLGKALSGVIPSWLMSVSAVVLTLVVSSILSGALLLPDIAIVIHVIIVVPTFIAAFIGLVGFGQLLLGMRENRILNFVLFVPAFAALYGSGYAIASGITASWQYMAILFAASLIVLGISSYLTRYLSRERIVTTIE